MRVLFIISTMGGGGAERTVANLANYWVEKGWDIAILTFSSDKYNNSDFYKLSPNIKRFYLIPKNHIFNNFIKFALITKFILNYKPEVIIGFMTGGAIISSIMKLIFRNILVIGSERTYPPKQKLSLSQMFLRKYFYKFLDYKVAVSSEISQWLQSQKLTNCVVIPNFIQLPMASFEPFIDPNSVCIPGRKILLAVGRLSYEKQFDILIKAFNQIESEYSEWDLVILGEGKLRLDLESLANDLNINDRVFMPGIAGNISNWYLHANIFVLCSNFEGFPNSLLEAMAHGVPAVSFDCTSGPRDIIDNNVNGLLISDMTIPGLASGLSLLMGDSSMRLSFSKEASLVLDKFSFQKITKQWDSLIKK